MSEAQDATREHQAAVAKLLRYVAAELGLRAAVHDASKLESPEVEVFDKYTAKLKALTYGSIEYKDALEQMAPALAHHYTQNRHHPEHFKLGLTAMTLVDLIEMLCDWKAATQRHADGNMAVSLEINENRFNIPEALMDVLHNTVDWYRWKEEADAR